MVTAREKLEWIAQEVGMDVNTLNKFLHDELNSLQIQALMRNNKDQQLYRALTDNSEGVYYCLITANQNARTAANAPNDYVGNILVSIYDTVAAEGYIAQNRVNNTHLVTEDYVQAILNKYDDAGIICLIPEKASTFASVCKSLNRPCVLIDYPPEQALSTTVTLNIDNHQGAYESVEYLLQLGHRRIACIAGKRGYFSADERLAGYRHALEDANIDYDASLVIEGNWMEEAGEKALRQFMQLQQPPSAIVAANDLMAVGAVIAAKQMGYNVPDDISIIGFDDIPIASAITPALTTLRQPIQELGHEAATMMLQLLQGKQVAHQHQKLPLEMVIRHSTAPY